MPRIKRIDLHYVYMLYMCICTTLKTIKGTTTIENVRITSRCEYVCIYVFVHICKHIHTHLNTYTLTHTRRLGVCIQTHTNLENIKNNTAIDRDLI